MVLSNIEVQKALKKGWLVIDPLPQPPFPKKGESCPYDTTAVDLRLSDEIVVLDESLPTNIDLISGKFNTLARQCSKVTKITENTPYTLERNSLVLAQTIERIELPIQAAGKGSNLAARVEGKSSYARCGMLVHFTAPTIHCGFNGTITLEIINLGPMKINLYPGMYVCQLIVEQVKGTPFRNDSSFQNQNRPGG